MITQLHAVFLAKVVQEILSRLRTLTTVDCSSRAFSQKIEYVGNGRLDLGSEDNDDQTIIRHHLDASFIHDDAHWSGVVIEVSYSQKWKDLPHLADDYILETDGNIRVVVGLEIDYKTKKGTISMWRPNEIRNEQGKVELEAAETLSAQVYTLLVLNAHAN